MMKVGPVIFLLSNSLLILIMFLFILKNIYLFIYLAVWGLS